MSKARITPQANEKASRIEAEGWSHGLTIPGASLMAQVSVVSSLAEALSRMDEYPARDEEQGTLVRDALLQALRDHMESVPELVRKLDAEVV